MSSKSDPPPGGTVTMDPEGASGLGTSDIPHPDEAAALCSQWLARRSQQDALVQRWQALETRLLHSPCGEEQAESPGAAELSVLDAHIDEIQAQNCALLALLPGVAAATKSGLVAKLNVALAIVHREENAPAHALLHSIVRDADALD